MDTRARVFVQARRSDNTTAVRAAMVQQGHTYRSLAEAANVNHQTVWNMAHAACGFDIDKAAAVAGVLGKPVSALFSHKDGAEVIEP